jgi:hypothetical protein
MVQIIKSNTILFKPFPSCKSQEVLTAPESSVSSFLWSGSNIEKSIFSSSGILSWTQFYRMSERIPPLVVLIIPSIERNSKLILDIWDWVRIEGDENEEGNTLGKIESAHFVDRGWNKASSKNRSCDIRWMIRKRSIFKVAYSLLRLWNVETIKKLSSRNSQE